MKRVIVFRSKILSKSETFIKNHVISLKGNVEKVCLVGLDVVEDGLSLDDVDWFCSSTSLISSKLMKAYYKYLSLPIDLEEFVSEYSPCVIHAHFATDAALILPLAKKLNVPMVVTLHGYDVTVDFTRVKSVFNPFLLTYFVRKKQLTNYVRQFLPVSCYINDCALRNGFPEKKLLTHYLGIKIPDLISCDATYDPNYFNVIFVGRIVEKKGLIYLLKAISLSSELRRQLKIHVVGDGPLRPACEKYSCENDLNVKFYGFQDNVTVLRMIQHADLFCMPSTRAADGDNEGLPTVFMEALALKTPVLSFDQGPIPEIVMPGKGGFLAIDKSPESLKENLQSIMENYEDFNFEVARDYIYKNFNIEVQTKKLAELY